MIFSLAFANLIGVLGYGDWFPWALTVQVRSMVKTHAEWVGQRSYLSVALTGLLGLAATAAWWQSADRTR